MNEPIIAAGTNHPRAPLAASPRWDAFERDLAAALSILKNEFLIVSAKVGNRFVQFNARPDEGVFAEAVSNAYLESPEKLDEAKLAALGALGWSAPTHSPSDRSPVRAPNGSPNFFRHFPAPYSCGEIAHVAVRTLLEVYRVPGPESLEYKAFDDPGHPITLPALHIERAALPAPSPKPSAKRRGPTGFARLRAKVLAAAREGSGFGSLEYDADGDLSVPVGSRTGWIRPHEKPYFVRVHCQLLGNVEEDEELSGRIHEVNSRLPLARVIYSGGSVFLSVDFPAAPFVPAHLSQALAALASLADDVLKDLRTEEKGARVAN